MSDQPSAGVFPGTLTAGREHEDRRPRLRGPRIGHSRARDAAHLTWHRSRSGRGRDCVRSGRWSSCADRRPNRHAGSARNGETHSGHLEEVHSAEVARLALCAVAPLRRATDHRAPPNAAIEARSQSKPASRDLPRAPRRRAARSERGQPNPEEWRGSRDVADRTLPTGMTRETTRSYGLGLAAAARAATRDTGEVAGITRYLPCARRSPISVGSVPRHRNCDDVELA